MSYLKSIIVQSSFLDRAVSVGVHDSNIPESGNLSELTLPYIDEAISKLNFILGRPTGTVRWGVEQFTVESDSSISGCEDLDGNEIAEVSTLSLKNLMLEVKSLKEYCHQADNYKTIIAQAFSAIKINPSQYKRWSESDVDFGITINNVFVSLVLESSDFTLTETAFINQLNVNF
jgi:hypothetical protein